MDGTLRFPPEDVVGVPGESPEWRRPLGQSKSCMNIKRGITTPLFPAAASTHGSTWYPSHTMSMTSSSKSRWKPLGSTWRDWEETRPRTDVDNGSAYIHGCVPHWGKEAFIRMKGQLGHELTWAYYRMNKHVKHPQRTEVGETLPRTNVIEKMRFGTKNQFKFWSDLRPPFEVLNVQRVDDGSSGSSKPAVDPDGELYNVTYQCGIEYIAEHMWGDSGENGTLDNKLHGVAQVRIPTGFPKKRPIQILSWGKPMLNWMPKDEDRAAIPPEQRGVPPDQWMPIADELGIRPNSERMAACRELTRKATIKMHSNRNVTVPQHERLLLGPHSSLPQLAHVERTKNARSGSTGAKSEPATPGKVRQHRIWTSAAGFITYAG